MTKLLIIEEEIVFVQNALREKYVTTGEWEKMTEDEKEDSALAEMMNYERQRDDYKIMTAEESQVFLRNFKETAFENTPSVKSSKSSKLLRGYFFGEKLLDFITHG